MISHKLDRLESITRRQQTAGTEKLKKADVRYDDGTIQGVMEHIPAGGSGMFHTVSVTAVMPLIEETAIIKEATEV